MNSPSIPSSPEKLEIRPSRGRAIESAAASALIPGLGQLIQRRFGAALLQFGTVAAYMIASGSLAGRRAMLFALFWNLWSIVDAYRHGIESPNN